MALLNKIQQEEPVTGVIFAALYTGVGVYMSINFAVQAKKFYSDFFTGERKSVAHRGINKGKHPGDYKPKITPTYKTINVLILAASFCLTASCLSGAIMPFSTVDADCTATSIAILSFVQMGKTLMYIVFISRLYKIYQPSPYSYPFRCIAIFILMLIALCIGGIIVYVEYNSMAVSTYGSNDYPNWCGPGEDEFFFLICAVYIIVQDVAAVVGFLTAYLLPLRKMVKQIDEHNPDSKLLYKIAVRAHKTTVITGFATISTIVLLLLTGFITGAFSIPDLLISQICIHMFSSYYSDKRYYNIYCKCCSACLKFWCYADGFNLRDNEAVKELEVALQVDANDEEEIVSQAHAAGSVDTWSAVRVAGANFNVSFNYLLNKDGYDVHKPQEMKMVINQNQTNIVENVTNVQNIEVVEQKEDPAKDDDVNKEIEVVTQPEAVNEEAP